MITTDDSDLLAHLKSQLSGEHKFNDQADIFKLFPSLIYVLDLKKKKIHFFNQQRFTRMLGYSMDDVNSWEDDILELTFKDDHSAVLAELKKFETLSPEEHHCYQCRLNHKDGSYRYFRTSGAVLERATSGEPASLLFTSVDITENIISQMALQALKRLADETEEQLHFGCWSWDRETSHLEWTDGMYHLLEYKKSEIESKISNGFYQNHIKKEDLKRLRASIQHAVRHRKAFDCVYTLITGSGNERVVSSHGKLVVNESGEIISVLGVNRDITTETGINNNLLQHHELTLEKEAFLNQGSWEWNCKEDKLTCSPGMYRLFGYEQWEDATHIDIAHDFLQLQISEEGCTDNKEKWIRSFKNKQYSHEVTITDRQGIRKQLETYAKVIYEDDEQMSKVIGTTRDVTRLREYERTLEEKIQELNASNKELEEFAYVASHDLQEPLRKLTTFSEKLQGKYSDQLGAEGRLYLERIDAATQNMRVLIENLLEFSRTARGTHLFSFTDLNGLLNTVKTDLELKIEESGTVVSEGDLPSVDCIPSQIRQLFNNLINNAIKFRKKDGESFISIAHAALSPAEKDSMHLPVDKNYFKIVIKDNGIGFEKEYAERIFQIFQRLHGKSEYPGSGIGLAICKKIAENHNGLIFADSMPEQGASFTIVLPERQT
jgi:PAS domain S-box-containing protein